MALSNWDTLAFGPDGKPCNGILTAVEGRGKVEIYKNWVYFHNPDMWYANCGFVNDTVMSIHSGVVTIDRFEIHVARGNRQHAVYVLAYTWGKPKNNGESIIRAMAGIGCYAWSDKTPKYVKAFKIDTSKYDSVLTGSYHNGKGENYYTISCLKKDGTFEEFKINKKDVNEKDFEPEFIGIENETQNEFFNWLKNEIENNIQCPDKRLQEWYEKVEKNRSDGLRFNQGDQYFAKHLGLSTPATVVGKHEKPLISRFSRKDRNTKE